MGFERMVIGMYSNGARMVATYIHEVCAWKNLKNLMGARGICAGVGRPRETVIYKRNLAV